MAFWFWLKTIILLPAHHQDLAQTANAIAEIVSSGSEQDAKDFGGWL